jgi:hypothetical protein
MEYVEFLRRLDPAMLGLQTSSSVLNRQAYWALTSDKSERVLSSRYVLSNVAEDYFDVEASFTLSIHGSEGDGLVEPALRIDCTFYGHFHVEADVQAHKELAAKFAQTESWLLFWPFFRQFVADTVGRMAIPPVTIPLALGPGDYRRRQVKSGGTGATLKAKKRASKRGKNPRART